MSSTLSKIEKCIDFTNREFFPIYLLEIVHGHIDRGNCEKSFLKQLVFDAGMEDKLHKAALNDKQAKRSNSQVTINFEHNTGAALNGKIIQKNTETNTYIKKPKQERLYKACKNSKHFLKKCKT